MANVIPIPLSTTREPLLIFRVDVPALSDSLQDAAQHIVGLLYEHIEMLLAAYVTKFGGLPKSGLVRVEEDDGRYRHFVVHPGEGLVAIPANFEVRTTAYMLKWSELAGAMQPEHAEIVLTMPNPSRPGRIEIVAKAEAFGR